MMIALPSPGYRVAKQVFGPPVAQSEMEVPTPSHGSSKSLNTEVCQPGNTAKTDDRHTRRPLIQKKALLKLRRRCRGLRALPTHQVFHIPNCPFEHDGLPNTPPRPPQPLEMPSTVSRRASQPRWLSAVSEVHRSGPPTAVALHKHRQRDQFPRLTQSDRIAHMSQ